MPNTVGSAVAAPYASDILSNYDIYKPEKLNMLFRKYGKQGYEYFMLLKSLGFELPTANDAYSHYEERFIHETFTIGANSAAGAAGASVTLTVAATSIQHYGSNYYIYPRLWDTILFNDAAQTTASITAVTQTGATATIKVTPNRLTKFIPATVTGEDIVIISSAFAEGSFQPLGALAGTDQYTNNVQIIKETITGTGSEMTNQDWFDTLKGDEGESNSILGYMMKGQLDLDYRIALKASNALLFQEITDNTNTDLNDAQSLTNSIVKSTQGLIPDIAARGQITNYTPGLFSTSKFNDIVKKQDREFCGNNILCLLGLDLQLEIDDTFVDYFKETDISYVTENIFKGDSKLAMSVGFKSFKKGNRVFSFQQMGIFTHPKVGGAAGYDYSKVGLFLPIDMRKDKKTGQSIPSIGCRYKELGPYSRKMEVWDVRGAGAGQKVIAQDIANYYMRTQIGAHHIAVNRFVMLQPS